ncbi:MAG TPA: hypothetical protein VL551_06960 [Actinospica sp.]|jgi:hypothetical protein|nr:hypothetical protein [Actinospica sp.]
MSLPPYDQSMRELERQYQVVLPDSVGQPALGFREGVWFRVNAGAPRPVLIRSAIILCPHAAGSIVQIACWWMRENAHSSRALDLATELALCVGELARKAVEDDPLGMSLDDPLSNSQQNAISGFGTGLQQQPASLSTTGGYGAGSGLGTTGGYDTGYASGGYQTSNDPYAAPYGTGAPAAGATTVLPQIPADGGYGMPQPQRGPAIPPRGAGMPGGGPGGSGGYPQQRPGQQPMRPQQPGQGRGGYPPQGQGGRPPQRPTPRPEHYDEDPYGRPQGRPQGGGSW